MRDFFLLIVKKSFEALMLLTVRSSKSLIAEVESIVILLEIIYRNFNCILFMLFNVQTCQLLRLEILLFFKIMKRRNSFSYIHTFSYLCRNIFIILTHRRFSFRDWRCSNKLRSRYSFAWVVDGIIRYTLGIGYVWMLKFNCWRSRPGVWFVE